MEPGQERVPVVVVGAGPTGLTSALLLGDLGVRVLVVERRTVPPDIPRAVHLDDEVHRVLQRAGVAEGFAGLSRPALGLRLLDARHRVMAEVRRDRVGRNGWPEANMFDQPDLEALLLGRALAHPLIDLEPGTELVGLEHVPPGVLVRLRDDRSGHADAGGAREVAAQALLGCDGAASTVRGLLGIGMRDLRFTERWLVVDVRCSQPLDAWEGVHQVCDPARPATYMRVGAERYRWEFRLADGETAADLAGRLPTLLAPWLGGVPASELELVRAAEYVFRARLARSWRAGRVFLLGDAAHQTPPFVGQGLGSGLRDAANLAWKLALVLRGADERLLDTYEQERAPHARQLIRIAVLVGWAMTGGQDRAAAVRRAVIAAVVRVPGATSALGSAPPRLTPGLLVRRDRRRVGSRDLAGGLVPQPDVVAGGGRRRLDDVLGPGFAVLSGGAAGPELAATAGRLGAPLLQLGVDLHDDRLAEWLRRGRAQAALLRPDRAVLAAGTRQEVVRAATDLLALLGPAVVAGRRT